MLFADSWKTAGRTWPSAREHRCSALLMATASLPGGATLGHSASSLARWLRVVDFICQESGPKSWSAQLNFKTCSKQQGNSSPSGRSGCAFRKQIKIINTEDIQRTGCFSFVYIQKPQLGLKRWLSHEKCSCSCREPEFSFQDLYPGAHKCLPITPGTRTCTHTHTHTVFLKGLGIRLERWLGKPS